MRISGWSSDVCSSDLGGGGACGWRLYMARGGRSADAAVVHRGAARAYRLSDGARGADPAAGRGGGADRADLAARIARRAELSAELRRGHGDHRTAREPGDASVHGEIGRGSCRERVCPYVLITVVPGTLKKKTNQQTST